jgi:hypothetical protein
MANIGVTQQIAREHDDKEKSQYNRARPSIDFFTIQNDSPAIKKDSRAFILN